MAKHAIFLSGPVGVGKSALGRALSDRLSGGFIEGDDFSNPDLPWYCSILQTSQAMVRAARKMLENKDVVVIAYLLTCLNWIYFRRKFGDAGAAPLFVSLKASYSSIIDENRGRIFSDEECSRIQVMVAEGYGARPFSDLVVETDQMDFSSTLALLESEIRRMVGL